MRVILLTGKGGVGKTSLAAATALEIARTGKRTFLLSTDPAHNLADALAQPVGSGSARIARGLVAREVAVLDELDRSWSQIQAFLRGLLKEGADPMIADELLVFPGLEELVALRAIREVEATGDFDCCVVDCAPTGSTLRMLRFPDALRLFMDHFFDLERRGARALRPILERLHAQGVVPDEAVFDAVERLVSDVEAVRRILVDGTRTTARLVVNPARLVVAEARRSFAYLSLYGVTTDAVLVNRVLPDEAKRGFFARWAERERLELAEIEASFPIPRLSVPLQAHELRGRDDLAALGERLYQGRDPSELMTRAHPIRLEKRAGRTWLEIDLPGAAKEELDVVERGERGRGARPRRDPHRRASGFGRGSWDRARAPRRRCVADRVRVSGPPRDRPQGRPTRIVSLVPSLTESLFELGLGDRVVGVTDWCIHPADAVRGVPRVGGTKTPDRDAIIRLRPDLVIANHEENRRRDVERLEAAGLRVWVTDPRTTADGVALLAELAALGARPDRVAAVVAPVEAAFARARDAAAGPRPRTFCPIWKGPWMTVGGDTYIHDLLTLCGADNVFAEEGDRRYPIVSEERIVAAAPEVILLPDEPYAFGPRDAAALATLPIPAAASGRIHLIDGTLVSWYGPRIGRAIDTLHGILRV